MNNKKELLTEENYERGKKKLKTIALVILIVGILIGGGLIVTGLVKQNQTNSQYSEESKNNKKQQLEQEKQQLTQELNAEKQNLLISKTTLENKIKPVEDEIKKLEREQTNIFAGGVSSDRYYEIQDKIEDLKESIKSDKNSMSVIDEALNETIDHCSFAEVNNNTLTSKYCSLKNQITQKDNEISGLDLEFSNFNKDFNSFSSIPYYMIGGFIILSSGMTAFLIFIITKRREITAFTAQQVMPVAQEGIEKMAPSVGNAMETIGKSVAKGIKEGINEADENKQ